MANTNRTRFGFSRMLRFVCLIGSVLLGNTNGALDLTVYVDYPQASIITSSSENIRWIGFFLANPTVSLKLGRAADTGTGDPNTATSSGTATCTPRSWFTNSETCNDESILDGLPSNIRLDTHNAPRVHAVRVFVPRNDIETVGVFYFEISNGEETTRATFIQLQSSAPIVPETLTKTVSVGDTNVEIKMVVTSETPVRWRKDGLVINEWWESTVTLSSVTESDAGIYECYATEEDRTQGKQGITRLIVRGCPVGKWGPPYCNDDCPLCLNGGQCDHNTGECVCPVAFNGDMCQIPCGYNKFGKECSGVCSSRNDKACRGKAFCVPDPVGCTCNAGFKGIDCNEDCVSGTFGSGCTQTCHCASGSSVCNKATGACESGGCATGWSGDNCQQECEAGRFGPGCSQTCHCASGSSVCDRATGRCSGGCAAGWSGYNCQAKFHNIETVKVNPGQPATISCTIRDYPELVPDNVRLYKDDRLLSPPMSSENMGDYTLKVTFTINSPVRGDVYGCYYTTAQIGSDEVTIELFDLPRFQDSSRFSVSLITFTSFKISWNEWTESYDIGDPPVVGYAVYYRESGSSEWELRTQTASVTSDTISGLTPWTDYEIAIAVIREGAGGEGPKTYPYLNLNTNCYASADYDIHSTPTRDSLTFTWILSCSADYRLSLQLVDRETCDSPTYNSLKQTTSDSYYFDDLCPYSLYKLSITARGGGVDGPTWQVEERTSQDKPSGPPNNIRYDALSSNGVHFTWEQPLCGKRGGVITGYKYRLYNRTQADGDPIQANDIVSNSKTFDSLKPLTNYTFTIRAHTSAGRGPYSQGVSFSTPENMPSAPQDVSLPKATRNSITVQWYAPPGGLKLTSYTVEYWRTDHANPLVKEKITINEDLDSPMQYTISNLDAGVDYSIQVHASTSGGAGPPSDIVTQVLAEPGPPDGLEVSENTQTTLKFQWKPPLIPNGLNLQYQIKIQADSRDYDSSFETEVRYSNTDVLSSTTKVYDDLDPGTTYKLSVRAKNIIDWGDYAVTDGTTSIKVPSEDEIPSPVLTARTDSTITVSLSPVESKYAPISSYQVIVHNITSSKKRAITQIDTNHLTDYITALSEGLNYYITANLSADKLPIDLTIGDRKTYGGFYNAPLTPGAYYDIYFGIMSVTTEETKQEFRTKPLSVYVSSGTANTSSGPSGVVIAVAVVVCVLFAIVCGLLVLVFKRRRKPINLKNGQVAYQHNSPSVDLGHPKPGSGILESQSLLSEVEAKAQKNSKKLFAKTMKPISMEDLPEYIQKKKSATKENFAQEFKQLPVGQLMPWEVAIAPGNIKRNRYNNIVAYDHTRVILENLGDNNSDYINADYIKGYHKDKLFIATQGPSELTTKDFWYMVWQEGSTVILMATNLVESGKIKCEKYWPDDIAVYGDIKVSMLQVEMFADYVIRTFRLVKVGENSDERYVKQFHFTVWPDMGVPMYATAVLGFLRRIDSAEQIDSGPTIVHCSAGVGRTGTYIAIENQLAMAKAENQVDVFNCVKNLRMQRINMVQTQEQYVFIYEAILEAMLCGETQIAVQELRNAWAKLTSVPQGSDKTALQKEYENLIKMSPIAKTQDCLGGQNAENVNKNRYLEILPLDRCRPFLMTQTGESSNNYINASFVNGYKHKDAYIVTQAPLPNTVGDFWSMVYDYNSYSIVMLNVMDEDDLTLVQYWPEQGTPMKFGPLTIELIETNLNYGYATRKLELSNSERPKENARVIQLFQMTEWAEGELLPNDEAHLVEVMSGVERWQQQTGNKPITVHCRNGLGRSGVFCAYMSTCEKLKVEQEVDVFSAVKILRINRPGMIENLEQYTSVYEAVLAYIDSFETYMNFK